MDETPNKKFQTELSMGTWTNLNKNLKPPQKKKKYLEVMNQGKQLKMAQTHQNSAETKQPQIQ